MSLSEVTSKWLERCRKEGFQFAKIQTDSAIYERVAIVRETPNIIIVEFLSRARSFKKKSAEGQEDYIIVKTETIARKSIKNISYYKE